MPTSTTVILGAGFGGLATANALRAKLHPEHRVVIVDRAERFTVGAGQTWVMLGRKRPEEISRPLSNLKQRGIEWVRDEIVGIDPKTRTVTLAKGKVEADHLVVALGAHLELGAVPGLANAHTFYTLDGAEKLRGALATLKKGKLVLVIPRAPFKCPPAPYEAALLLADACDQKKLRPAVSIEIYSVEGAPMATAGPEMGAFIRGLLEKASVAYHPQHKLTKVDESARTLTFEGGAQAGYDLLIAIPPHVAPKVVQDAGLAAPGGWVTVDPRTLRTSFERVYAIGDVASVALPGRFKPDAALSLPKAGVFAERQGEVVAAQIAAEVQGKKDGTAFDGKGFCFIETAADRAVRGEGDFFAMPHPSMVPRGAPDAAQYADKLSWVSSVLDTHLGTPRRR